MRVLGISADFHDSSASLVVDGRIVCSAAEERFTRLKHDASFPIHAAMACLEQSGQTQLDIDRIVFYEEPWSKFSRVLAETLSGFPRSIGRFNRAGRSWLTKKLWIHNKISKTFDIHPERVSFVSHHESHAAQAFYPSGFAESAILTADGVGEWTCTSIAQGSQAGGIKVFETYEYPNSLGLVYAAFTAFLGFKPNDGECSTMALAAFGKPRYEKQVRRVLSLNSDGSYQVDPSFFDFLSGERNLFTASFLALFGDPRKPGQTLPFSSTSPNEVCSPDHQRFANIAASIQLVLEDALLGLAQRAHRLTGLNQLCLAGGTAMNAVAVTRLLKEGPFDQVFVPPDPGDGGAASGAALLASGEAGGVPQQRTPYLGKSYEDEYLAEVLNVLEIAEHHRLSGCRDWSGRLSHQRYAEASKLVEIVAHELSEGAIVGWVQGRFEQGPRALGNRSILVDPNNASAVGRLSRSVKRRAAYRPYALSVALEDAPRVLPGLDLRDSSRTARWMQSVHRVDSAVTNYVTQALHVDLTTRPQICSPTDNPLFHQLLLAFGVHHGLAALLNTSFNESGYPMVSSPTDAIVTFLHTDIDVLVIGMTVIRKIV
jgi:carbamoyltransferase